MLVDGAGTVKDTNLHGVEKEKIRNFYDSEVEYILHGQPSQKMNNIMTRENCCLSGSVSIRCMSILIRRKDKGGDSSDCCGRMVWTGRRDTGDLESHNGRVGMGEAVIDVADLMKGQVCADL